ncbi:Stk1 family PASTA domain-containing Ser/Thr kinase [Humibacter sp. BT305]|nr:Stk1 family PASTA domain-containing Ser/Thr kinase [Humibacter sp. BT305]
MTSATTDPMLGRLIDGRYQVKSRIARGGMATVYVATDLRLDRRVAIKVMHGHLADDEVFRERFVREARSAARLAHPNVVNVFDQGQDSDMAYLVMEYLPGMTLRDLLRERGRLGIEQAVDVMDAVLGGLAAAHKAGIVHRDLKPENVLLADDGRIKIGDFGLARAASANTATGQALLGTIAYLSPELLTRGVADTRSDVYAAGIMFSEMLVGAQPFTGDQPMQIAFKHANEPMPVPSSANPEVPEGLDDLILWATVKDPEERPADAKEMLDRLREVEAGLGIVRHAGTASQRTMLLPPEALGPSPDDRSTTVFTAPSVPAEEAAAEAAGPEATVQLVARKARRRRARGWWLLVAVLVVAAGLGGTGWWYSAGPGSMTTIPTLAGSAPDSALAQLQEMGLKPDQRQQTSPTVAAGTVIDTDPPGGTSIRSGSAVTVVVSSGPAMLAVPTLAGLAEADARAAITAAGFTAGTSTTQFSSDVASGVVIAATDPSGTALGSEYGEQQTIDLVVSLGAVPDVTGQTLDEAKAALGAVGLVATEGAQDYNEDVPEGSVYQATVQTDPVRPGDSVVLDVSRGPAPVPVPNVEGLTRDEAKQALQAVGLVPVYSVFWDAIPNALTKVQSVSPSVGTSVKKGTNVNLGITASG